MSEQIDPLQVDGVVENDLQPDIKGELPKLQAMGFGELLDTTFSLYRKHFWTFLGISAGSSFGLLVKIAMFFFDDSLGRGAKVAIWIPTVGVFWGISVFVISGLVFASAESYLGRRVRIGAALRHGGRRFLRCFAGSLLFVLLAVVLIFFLSAPVAIFGLILGNASDLVGPLFVFLIVGFVIGWFIVYWCFFAAAVLVEGKSVSDGLERRGELISDDWWRIVGAMFAIFFLHIAVGLIFRIAFGFLLSLTGFIGVMEFLQTINLTTLWQLLTTQPEVSLSYVLICLINLGIDTFTTPIWVIGSTLLYFNQRIRKEGFDIEMMATHQGG